MIEPERPARLPSTPEEFLAAKRWERLALYTHLTRLLERLSVEVVLDVGANTGQYARLLRAFGYEGDIVSFEPVASAFAALEEACAGDRRWRAFKLALGSGNEERPIKLTTNPVLSSFLLPSDYALEQFGESSGVTGEETVTVRALDAVLDECLEGSPSTRIFLKLDTQGWDIQALRGAAGSLSRIIGLQSELSVKPIYEGMTGWLEAVSHMTSLGFELTGLFPVTRDRRFSVVELDCVMARPGNVGPDRPDGVAAPTGRP